VRARLGAFVVLVAVLASGCGYALAGKGGSLPDHIRRIGVPTLVNQSTTPELDQILTNAIRQELLARGRYRVVHDSTGVDAVLTGTVMPITTNLSGITEARQASRYLITVTASIEFRDLTKNAVHWASPTFRASEEYEVPTGTGATDQTLVFQADRQALERLARTFARTLVASIFEGM
jgi:outer membrane lipopolysaccharide assembly protein LptE/RlpB